MIYIYKYVHFLWVADLSEWNRKLWLMKLTYTRWKILLFTLAKCMQKMSKSTVYNCEKVWEDEHLRDKNEL